MVMYFEKKNLKNMFRLFDSNPTQKSWRFMHAEFSASRDDRFWDGRNT